MVNNWNYFRINILDTIQMNSFAFQSMFLTLSSKMADFRRNSLSLSLFYIEQKNCENTLDMILRYIFCVLHMYIIFLRNEIGVSLKNQTKFHNQKISY